MSPVVAAPQSGTRLRASQIARILCWGVVGLLLAVQAEAAPMITLGGGVANPPPSLMSTGLAPPQTAIADKATLFPIANFSNILQKTLDAQGFTAANHWTLNTNTLTLAANATFDITTYELSLNGGGTAFGETFDVTLAPNLAAPGGVPAGATVTEHWLQLLNEDQQYGGFGYAIAGEPGFWQMDNGDHAAAGPASGPGNGPYYDSFAAPGAFSVPPTFHDFPHYYAGVGTYLHFTVVPVYDVYIPPIGPAAASETIYTADFGISWGFYIVPEPSTIILLVVGMVGIFVYGRRRK